MKLALREVRETDIDLLFRWANESTVRQNAFHTEPIPFENHQRWFEKMMADKDVENYILYDADEENTLFGQIRFNIEERTALIDYSIDAAWRGQGMGALMLLMAEEKICSHRWDVDRFKAEVKYGNAASARVFAKCGYDMVRKDNFLEFTKYVRG